MAIYGFRMMNGMTNDGYEVIQDGHTMFPDDVIKELKLKDHYKAEAERMRDKVEELIRHEHRRDDFFRGTIEELQHMTALAEKLREEIDEAKRLIYLAEESMTIETNPSLREQLKNYIIRIQKEASND